MRDALLLALTFSAGVFEAICFLTFGKVFTAFQTGNVLFVGVIAAGTRPPAGPEPVTVLVSLVAFAVGAAVSMPVLRAFNGEAELPDDQVVHVWPRQVSVVLTIALVVQAGFLVLWLADRPSTPTDTAAGVLVGLSAFAMGMQMNAARRLQVPGVSTTAATATYIGLISGVVSRSLQPRAVTRLTAVLVCIAAGALIGDLLLAHAAAWAPVPAVALTATAVACAWVLLPPDHPVSTRPHVQHGRPSSADRSAHPATSSSHPPALKEMP